MPELRYGIPFESHQVIPHHSPRVGTYSWDRIVGLMPHQSVILTEKEVTENESDELTTASSVGDVKRDKDDAGKNTGRQSSVFRIMACGAGLFSDGYLNGVIGPVNTILMRMYPNEYAQSVASQNVASIAFLGTVLGQLAFGFLVDLHSRKLGMVLASGLLILFSVLCACSYGAGGSVHGMLSALTVFRFFLGVGIGGEYPSGSVATAEATESRKKGTRNRWFVVFTNLSINVGFMASGIMPLIFLKLRPERIQSASQEEYIKALQPVWRGLLGIGAIFPAIILGFRLFWTENETFKKNSLRNVTAASVASVASVTNKATSEPQVDTVGEKRQVPYSVIFRYYWRPLVVISLIWFMYDFGAYAFGIYGSYIVGVATQGNTRAGGSGSGAAAPLLTIFGYTSLLLFFNLPGSLLGAFGSDWFGCQPALLLGATLQAIFGIVIAIFFTKLKENLVAFVVLYGLFLSCGEFGPGDNVGLLAAKFSATGVRGRCYGIAAAMGKIGAFVGSWVFPLLVGREEGGKGRDADKGMKRAFWVASAMCLLTGILGMWGVKKVGQDMVTEEDERFRRYLEEKGYVFGGQEEGEKDAVELRGSISNLPRAE